MLNNDFEKKLAEGQRGESLTFVYTCRELHYIGVPLSKIVDFKDKGPRLYIPNNSDRGYRLVAVPDTLFIHFADTPRPIILPPEFWQEVKLKNKCSYYRINQAWQSGIDKKSYLAYLDTDKTTKKPVWIFHLIFPTQEEDMNAQGVPLRERPAPTGLYAHPVTLPPAPDRNPNPKMIYWQIKAMYKIAELEDVLAASKEVA